ncbi:MAG: Gfo/Idh/MocA family oxidoreductase [Phycisphaeraceae bacterium]
MTKVGIIGLGMMGSTHLDVYSQRDDATVFAVSDIIPERLAGKAKAEGNIEGQAQGGADLSQARRYDEGMKLIADDEVELVDICLPTPLHRQYAEAALAAGKHVMVEKPLARTAADAQAIAEAAERAPGMTMVAQCMRFWPGWDWLKAAIDDQRFGKVLAAHFRRLASHPGGPFYSDGKASGGALVDLHVHDTDFVHHCFGLPEAVYSRGYSTITGEPDHLITHYLYGDAGPMISAEGGWAMAKGFSFQMQFTVNFEKATATFDLANQPTVTLFRDGQAEPVDVGPGMGYEHEIAYFLDCIRTGQPPQTVTVAEAAATIQLVEAEHESIRTGQIVQVDQTAPTATGA